MAATSKRSRRLSGLSGEKSGLFFEAEDILCSHQSAFQHIEVIETADFGRVLLLDNEIMTTDWDGFVYPEMIMHPALMSHPAPRAVTIIGGGDGGAVTEACRHPDLDEVLLCEIDEEVVKISQKYFPQLATGLKDPRTRLIFEDGREWLVDKKNCLDVLVVDGTDPVGPGKVLFAEAFYQEAVRALRPGGVFVQQIESPFYSIGATSLGFELRFEEIVARARRIFKKVHVYCTTIPTYFGSYWAFLYAGDEALSVEPLPERWEKIAGQTRFYTPDIHRAALTLPPFVQELLS